MASRLIVLCAALAVSQAGPVWFTENGLVPGTIFIREARSQDFAPPSFAYGFGSGFSSNIGGISHSTGIGASFQSGDGQAYGSGIAGNDGNAYARGVGYANANPAPQPIYRNTYPYAYSPYNGLRRNYGNNFAVSSAQNVGNYGATVAQTRNTPYGSTATAVQNAGHRGLGYGSTLSGASNEFGSATASSDAYGNAVSSVQSRDNSGYNSAISASQNVNGVTASTAHAVHQDGRSVLNSGSSSINGPGIQAAQSHSINTYNY